MLYLRKHRRSNNPWTDANHIHFADDVKMGWHMARCDSTSQDPLATLSIATAIQAWMDGTNPQTLVVEDGLNWDSVSDYWVTNSPCRLPE